MHPCLNFLSITRTCKKWNFWKACFKGKSLKTIILILPCPFIWVKLYPIIKNTFQLGKSWRPFQLKHFSKKKMYVNVPAWQNTSVPKMFLIITYAAYETFDK